MTTQARPLVSLLGCIEQLQLLDDDPGVLPEALLLLAELSPEPVALLAPPEPPVGSANIAGKPSIKVPGPAELPVLLELLLPLELLLLEVPVSLMAQRPRPSVCDEQVMPLGQPLPPVPRQPPTQLLVPASQAIPLSGVPQSASAEQPMQ